MLQFPSFSTAFGRTIAYLSIVPSRRNYPLIVSEHVLLYNKVMQRIALLSLWVVVQRLGSDVNISNLSEDDNTESIGYWRSLLSGTGKEITLFSDISSSTSINSPRVHADDPSCLLGQVGLDDLKADAVNIM